jgi:hypothetical protein
MTELPKSLRDAGQNKAEDDATHLLPGDEERSGYIEGHDEGIHWLYDHLLSQTTEFDEYKDELQELAQSYSKVCGHEREAFIAGARWQHAQTSAIYQAKLAEAKEKYNFDEKTYLEMVIEPLHKEIERLKDQLRDCLKTNQEYARCLDIESNKNEKLAARVVELEGFVAKEILTHDQVLGYPMAKAWMHIVKEAKKALRGEK